MSVTAQFIFLSVLFLLIFLLTEHQQKTPENTQKNYDSVSLKRWFMICIFPVVYMVYTIGGSSIGITGILRDELDTLSRIYGIFIILTAISGYFFLFCIGFKAFRDFRKLKRKARILG